jgi:peptidyl-prolyl cis-trans isomerase D
MFDIIRKHIRWLLGFVLLLIIPAFVFWGVDGYTRFTDGTNAPVAEIDGREITRTEFEQAHLRTIERVRREDPQIDPALLDSPEARRQTLDSLVRERVLFAAADRLHLAPTDTRLQRLFVSEPEFAGLRNPDGTVNRDLLAMQGMNSEMFVQRLRQDLAVQQVLGVLGDTVVVPPLVADKALDPLLQQREIELEEFNPMAFRSRVQPTDEQIQAYYDANVASFRSAEQAEIEYLVLDIEALARDVPVAEQDLRRYYEENISRYTRAEERRASHILVRADDTMSSSERTEARRKAEALLAEVRRSPTQFAAVARRSSDDDGSAPQGGDLDWFGRGGMVKPFEDAVYAMRSGEISPLVESEFGFHIITLTGVRGGERTPYEAVRAEIDAEVRRNLAQRRYAEAAEQFTNLVYEQAESLDPAAERLGLQKRTATVERTPAPGAAGALASTRLLDAVFSTDSVQYRRNTDAVELGSNQLAAARVLSHSPARTLPLEEVRADVRERVIARESAALARAAGEQRLAALRDAPDEALPIQLTISRPQGQVFPRELIDAALGADASQLPALTSVDLGEQGFLVMRVTRVLPRPPIPGGDAPLRSQVAQAWALAEAEVYLDALRTRHKAVVTPLAETVIQSGQ